MSADIPNEVTLMKLLISLKLLKDTTIFILYDEVEVQNIEFEGCIIKKELSVICLLKVLLLIFMLGSSSL